MSYPTNNIEPGIRIVGFSLTCVAGSLVPPDGAFRQPFCWGFLSRYPTLSANHFYLASALGAGIDNIGSMQPQISRTYPLLHHLNDFSLQGGGGGGGSLLNPPKKVFPRFDKMSANCHHRRINDAESLAKRPLVLPLRHVGEQARVEWRQLFGNSQVKYNDQPTEEGVPTQTGVR